MSRRQLARPPPGAAGCTRRAVTHVVRPGARGHRHLIRQSSPVQLPRCGGALPYADRWDTIEQMFAPAPASPPIAVVLPYRRAIEDETVDVDIDLPPTARAAVIVVAARYKCLLGSASDCQCDLVERVYDEVGRLTGHSDGGAMLAEVHAAHAERRCAGAAEFLLEFLRQVLDDRMLSDGRA